MGFFDVTSKIIKSIAYPSEMVPSIDDHADDGEHHFDPVTEHDVALSCHRAPTFWWSFRSLCDIQGQVS